MKQNKKIDFKGQKFSIGIDVHERDWEVAIRQSDILLKRMTINASPKILADYMKKHYPGGDYYSVYEAGFSGYWAHRQLCEYGIQNIIINAADVPTKDKEKRRKTDRIDANKLSRELANGSLEPIYVPSPYHQSLRSLVHLRERNVSHQTRIKNRIKMFLYFYGIKIPPTSEIKHWSKRFLVYLKQIQFEEPIAKEAFDDMLRELDEIRTNVLRVTRQLRKYARDSKDRHVIKNLLTVSGVGFVTAVTFYAVICDITRFACFNRLSSFVGLVPSEFSTGKKPKTTGITPRRDRKLRYLIIEAAWVAIRRDPALLMAYNELSQRMDNKKAIIRIAKKLLSRMHYVWINNQPYECGVIE